MEGVARAMMEVLGLESTWSSSSVMAVVLRSVRDLVHSYHHHHHHHHHHHDRPPVLGDHVPVAAGQLDEEVEPGHVVHVLVPLAG